MMHTTQEATELTSEACKFSAHHPRIQLAGYLHTTQEATELTSEACRFGCKDLQASTSSSGPRQLRDVRHVRQGRV
jgi:hypothetical protein